MTIQRKAGFTLVELLVVMAIIAILASIVVPGVIGHIKKARATRAHAEVKGMELALSKMLADAGRNSLQDLFNKSYWDENGQWRNAFNNTTAAAFVSASEIYSSAFYALLRSGRLALSESDPQNGNIPAYSTILDSAVVSKLGTNYMDLGLDPYGNRYNIFPGPFTASFFFRNTTSGNVLPIPFRTFANDAPTQQLPGGRNSGGKSDQLTVNTLDAATDEERISGFTAPMDKVAYIWSNGENGNSDQADRAPEGAIGLNAYSTADEAYKGGGDDINNWDNDRTWERLYN